MLTDAQIESKLRELVREERRLQLEILELIREADRRKLWAERGFSSAFEWLVKGLGYSEGAAHRRLSAARLTREMPELEAKVEAGAFSLSTLASMQTAFRREERRTGARLGLERKREVASQVEGKTQAQAERALATAFPEAPAPDRLAPVGESQAKLTVTLSAEALSQLERARELLAHAMPGASWSEIVERLAREFVERKDPLRKTARERKAESATAPAPVPAPELAAASDAASAGRRNPAAEVRRVIFRRAGARCEFVDRATGRRCESRSQLEVDHVRPWALGGATTTDNLRVLCGAHNRARAERTFGVRGTV